MPPSGQGWEAQALGRGSSVRVFGLDCHGPALLPSMQEEDLTVRNLCLCHGHPLCGGEELELKHEAEIQAHLRVQLVFWKQSREKKQEQKNDGSGLRTVTLNNPSFSKKRTSSSTDCLSGTD